MNKTFIQLSSQDIPKESCIIRLKDSSHYIHRKDDTFYFYPKFHGCFVFMPSFAEELIEALEEKGVPVNEFEVVNFFEAYKIDGMLEHKIMYN